MSHDLFAHMFLLSSTTTVWLIRRNLTGNFPVTEQVCFSTSQVWTSIVPFPGCKSLFFCLCSQRTYCLKISCKAPNQQFRFKWCFFPLFFFSTKFFNSRRRKRQYCCVSWIRKQRQKPSCYALKPHLRPQPMVTVDPADRVILHFSS